MLRLGTILRPSFLRFRKCTSYSLNYSYGYRDLMYDVPDFGLGVGEPSKMQLGITQQINLKVAI